MPIAMFINITITLGHQWGITQFSSKTSVRTWPPTLYDLLCTDIMPDHFLAWNWINFRFPKPKCDILLLGYKYKESCYLVRLYYISGCPNTPGKGVRYCKMHEGLARSYVDEGNIMEDEGGKRVRTDEDLVIQRILSNKVTRQGNFCEVNADWC